MGIFFFEIYTKNEPPSFVEDLLGSLWLCLFLFIASGSFLALSRISYKAGFDLWRWKNRGRKPAYIAMMLFSLLGILFLLVRETPWTLLGLGICTPSVFFLVYLQLPSVLQTFASPAADAPR